MADKLETARKVQALLARTKSAMPALMDRAIETGDYSEIDKTSALVDRLLAASQNITNEQDPSLRTSKTPPVDRPATAPPSEPDALEAALQLDDQTNAQKANARRLAVMDEPIQEARKVNLPPAIEKNRAAMVQAVRALNAGRNYAQLPEIPKNASIPELMQYRKDIEAALPDKVGITGEEPQPSLNEKRELLRLIDNVLRDEKAVLGYNKPDPAALAAKNFESLKKSGALSPEEIRRGAAGPGPDPRKLGQIQPPAESTIGTDMPGAQGGLTDINFDPKQPAAAAPAVAKKYGDDQRAFLADLEKTAQRLRSERDLEFIHRVKAELGDRPKRFTWEKLLIALTAGAAAAVSAKMTGRYDGGALVDLGADQRAYDARKQQIGRETFSAYEGRLRNEEASARQGAQLAAQEERDIRRTESREKVEAAKLKQREAHGKAQNAVALLNARVREKAASDMASARRINAAGKAVAQEIDGLQTKLHSLGQAFSMNALSEADYEAKSQAIIIQISQLSARMEAMALGEDAGAASAP